MQVDEEVILTLQKQIQELRGQVESLEYFRDLHMGTDVGQSGFNYPHPNQKVNVAEYGGGIMRLDKNGAQIIAPNSQQTGLFYVQAFADTINNSGPYPRAQLSGRNNGGSLVYIASEALAADGGYASNTSKISTTAAQVIVECSFDGTGNDVVVTFESETGGRKSVTLSGDCVLNLGQWASDFSFTLADADLWYRTDIDRFRARANGITRNLTIDGTNTTLTIATGVVTITTSFHAIDTEAAAATDDLDTISGGQTGQVLYIHAANGARDVVAKDGTGNLKLVGDFTMNNTEDMLTLIFDGTNWLELARSDNGV